MTLSDSDGVSNAQSGTDAQRLHGAQYTGEFQ